MRRSFLSVAVLATVAAVAFAGVAVGEQVKVGNLILKAGGNVSPKKLPKKKMVPIKLKVNGKISTDDSSTPPITDRIVIDFDKDGTVFTKGLPTCNPNKLINTKTKVAKRKCKKALVGTGSTVAVVDFPDQAPFDAKGPLLAFNGTPQGGKPRLIFHVYANVPTPTAFVVPAKISNAPGKKWGKRVTINVPDIAGRNGTLTEFNVTINKRWTKKVKKGKKVKKKKFSYLLAKCPDRKFTAKAQVNWDDGRKANLQIQRPCKPKK